MLKIAESVVLVLDGEVGWRSLCGCFLCEFSVCGVALYVVSLCGNR